jgi:hypothetical protein
MHFGVYLIFLMPVTKQVDTHYTGTPKVCSCRDSSISQVCVQLAQLKATTCLRNSNRASRSWPSRLHNPQQTVPFFYSSKLEKVRDAFVSTLVGGGFSNSHDYCIFFLSLPLFLLLPVRYITAPSVLPHPRPRVFTWMSTHLAI